AHFGTKKTHERLNQTTHDLQILRGLLHLTVILW
ncbi:MAG: hypothetical protein ACI8QW_001653, partial [Saprospiraceae bacterium]